MANMLFANNCNTTLNGGITAIATLMVVTSATGFPIPTGSQYFYCTLADAATQTTIEIVKVTAVSGTTFTIVRGQDGTTGTIFASGAVVSLRLVRASLNNFPKLDEDNTFSGAITFSTPLVATNMVQSSTSSNGYLSSTDWNTFNGKQPAGTYVNSVSGTTGRITSTGGTTPVIDLASGVATAGTTGSSTLIPVVTIDTYGRVTSITTAANPQGTVTSVTGTTPVVSSGGATPAISMAAATSSVNGYLTSTDWSTFNSKVSSQWTTTGSDIYYTTGSVGMGVTSPTTKLELGGGTSGQSITFSNTSNGVPRQVFGIAYKTAGFSPSVPAIAGFTDTAFDDSLSLRFYNGYNETMRLNASGNLGLGTASPANYSGYSTFTLNNTSGSIIDFNVNAVRTGSIFATSTYLAVTSKTNVPIVFETNATEKMRLSAAGYLGIATNNPSAPLEVVGNGVTASIKSANDGGSTILAFKNTSGTSLWDIGIGVVIQQDELVFRRQGSTVLYLNASGGASIGTASTAVGAGSLLVNKSVSVGAATPSTSGAGITFPATQSASSDVNTLDDYEEGTWLPTFVTTGGSFTYGQQQGQYVKIGKRVFCNFYIRTSAATVGTGNCKLGGIPFTPGSAISVRGGFGIGRAFTFAVNVPCGLTVGENDNTLFLTYRLLVTGDFLLLQASDLSTGASDNNIYGSFYYDI